MPFALVSKTLDELVGRKLSPIARIEMLADRRRISQESPRSAASLREVIRACASWLCTAQDNSISSDGGVARHYSLLDGWGPSYPETTGYIIPTLLDCWKDFGNKELRLRAVRAADWLVSIQFPEGGFQGGTVFDRPVVPVIFNTGQILFGLARAAHEIGDRYREPLFRAARWLVRHQDPDGVWRRYPSPFAGPGERAYDAHVAWGMLEAAYVLDNSELYDSAMRHLRMALKYQDAGGFITHCCLTDPKRPLTHTIGYYLRGILEGYRWSREISLLEAAERTSRRILASIRADGFLAGRLNSSFEGSVRWSCLTGSVQIAHCLLILSEFTGDRTFFEAGSRLNRFVAATVHLGGSAATVGAVKASYPVNGDYNSFEFLNWAAKFFTDSARYELELRLRYGITLSDTV